MEFLAMMARSSTSGCFASSSFTGMTGSCAASAAKNAFCFSSSFAKCPERKATVVQAFLAWASVAFPSCPHRVSPFFSSASSTGRTFSLSCSANSASTNGFPFPLYGLFMSGLLYVHFTSITSNFASLGIVTGSISALTITVSSFGRSASGVRSFTLV